MDQLEQIRREKLIKTYVNQNKRVATCFKKNPNMSRDFVAEHLAIGKQIYALSNMKQSLHPSKYDYLENQLDTVWDNGKHVKTPARMYQKKQDHSDNTCQCKECNRARWFLERPHGESWDGNLETLQILKASHCADGIAMINYDVSKLSNADALMAKHLEAYEYHIRRKQAGKSRPAHIPQEEWDSLR